MHHAMKNAPANFNFCAEDLKKQTGCKNSKGEYYLSF